MENSENDIFERIELAVGRLSEIKDEKCHEGKREYKKYFDAVSDFLLLVYDVSQTISETMDIEKLVCINKQLYQDIIGDNYNTSYANPEYATEKLGKNGAVFSMLYSEIRAAIAYVYEKRMLNFAALCELFLEVYGICDCAEEGEISDKYIKEAIYYYMYDYADVLVAERICDTLTPEAGLGYSIVMNSRLDDLAYLYQYGEYIGSNEIKTAEYLNKLPKEKITAMAKTYVEGYIKGFETMRVDLKPKKTVNIRYSIGQERMIRCAIELFANYGLKPVIYRYAVSRCCRKLTGRCGYVGTPANKQYEYDHRMDEAVFFDKAYMERKLSVIADTYEKHKELANVYAGPAVIEVFGENPFKPMAKDTVCKLTKKQQSLSVEYTSKNAEIVNKYIPRDKYSFTIIAYPIPEIGDNFEEIYDEIVRVNTLDNEKYKDIQQAIIDTLDNAEYVKVVGANGNKTDMKVMLHNIDKSRETNFENCLADVNIPLGEVFTSPVLTGTEGILNVSSVYLNELKFTDLLISFKDGKISDYSCSNFKDEKENKAYIKENIMFNHETLPIGEFAIGTNTTAYVMANKYDILYKLPILIVEKMGPHFAVGDTCYSYSEDNILYNPDGREIVAKENECSMLRNSKDKEERMKAYFNCHTDITIPYEEIGGIYAVSADGTSKAIIENGRFVLSGTEELNLPFKEMSR